MAIIRFGHTWWGEKFLNALNHIDYSNRLPRGERYARNGSVVSIDINENNISAKVSGRRPRPYAVSMELSAFSKKQIAKISGLISSNPYYLSQFEARILPEELYEELTAIKVELFPASWKDMHMHCSCPDWAVPCKHIAAVIYLIANEIDKNPFIIFNLRRFDLLETFKSVGKSAEEEIISIGSLLEEKPKKFTYYQEKLEGIDFARIPDLLDPTVKLLTEKPLFYLRGDFKEILHKRYKKTAKEVIRHINRTEILEDLPEDIYRSVEIRIRKGKFGFKGSLRKKDKTLEFDSSLLQPLVDYLQVLTLGDLNKYPPVISFLIMVHSFCLKLLEKSGYVPDILSLDNDKYIIRWIPSLFNQEIKDIFERLLAAIPVNIIKYGTVSLAKKDQLLFLISFFIGHYFRLLQPLKEGDQNDINALFFDQSEFLSKGFEKQETAKTIHLWLGRFFIHPKNCFPVIKISEMDSEKQFLFDILVKDKRELLSPPLPLTDFLNTDNDEKFPLLKDLSLLSTYLPAVNSVLRTKGEAAVSSESFVDIWFSALPVLKTLNIETMLPKALQNVFIPSLSLSFKQSAAFGSSNLVSYLSLQKMMEFQWTVALGNEFIKPAEFNKLSEKFRGIIRYKDKYIYLDAKQLEKIRKQLEKRPEFAPMELLKIQLEDKYKDVPIQTDKKLKKILKELFTPKEIELPVGLNATLRGYQEAGYRWLYHNYKIGIGSLIADDMGLGKTIQIIALLLKLKEEGVVGNKKVLIVVPASLLTNWQREIERFAPDLASYVFHGSNRKIEDAVDVVITTYGLARSKQSALAKTLWLLVITDEAQNIKNPDAHQSRAIKSIKADLKIAMTGTPVENRLMDYWSVLDFTMKNLLGNRKAFKESYAIPIEKFKDQASLKSFKALTSPFILRRVKTDKSIISDLPEKLLLNQYTSLTKEQAVLYQGLVDNMENILDDSDGINRSGLIFKLIIGLKQICNHPALYLKEHKGLPSLSGKSQLLVDLMEKIIDRDEKVLIFSQFKAMGALLVDILDDTLGHAPLFLHGGLTRKKRDALVDSFQNDQESKVFILSLKAGGTGLNLTAANNVIHYDLWWNPAVENQATDRAFRIGQQRNVNVYRMITQGTFEEKINAMLESKSELADLTVNQGEKWITELSNQELKELLKLER